TAPPYRRSLGRTDRGKAPTPTCGAGRRRPCTRRSRGRGSPRSPPRRSSVRGSACPASPPPASRCGISACGGRCRRAAPGREDQQREEEHQGVAEIVGQVDERLELHPQRQARAQDAAEELPPGLHRPLRPAVLLALEAVDVDRQLGGDREIGEIEEAPPREL